MSGITSADPLYPYRYFISETAHETGLDGYTVAGWVASEMGPIDNPLNIGPGQHYTDDIGAARATAQLLATSPYDSVEAAARFKYPTETQAIAGQANAIANSPWMHPEPGGVTRAQYENEILTRGVSELKAGVTFPEVTTSGGGGVTFRNPDGSLHNNGAGSSQPQGGIGGWVSDLTGSIFGPLVGVFTGIKDFFTSSSTWIRIGLFVGGAAIVLIGIKSLIL